MTKALEVFIPGFKPSPLQRAAIKRIQEYQKELNAHGVYLRSGMELEFMVEDRFDRLVPCTLNLKATNEYLKDAPHGLKWFQNLKNECTASYEAVTGETVDEEARYLNAKSFSPVGVAATTAAIKRHTMKDALLNSSCLADARPYGDAPFKPVFKAYPFLTAHTDSLSQYAEKTAALHVNVSLYNKKGENMFTKDRELMLRCAEALVRVQHQAGLAFLPRKSSLTRFNRKAHISVPGGLGMELVETSRAYSSVNLRGGFEEMCTDEAIAANAHSTRIENRLPGADADPFVAMAVTMAAMVQGLRAHTAGASRGISPKYPLPHDHGELIERMEASDSMRKLLGEEFFNAILDTYDKPQSVGR